jgi:signal transduction histidine kinase
VAGSARDISFQKELKDKLQKSSEEIEKSRNELYEYFMQAPIPMVILTGPDYYCSLANEPYEKLVGRRVTGKRVLEAFTEEEVGIFLPIMDEVYHTGRPYKGVEMPFIIPDASGALKTMYINLRYQPYRSENGQVIGIIASVLEVTEQVNARKRVETLVEDLNKVNRELKDASRAKDEFLSVASHELKTPVTSLKLQTQMIRRGIRPEENVVPSPHKLAKVFDTTLKQIERLSLLIEDLLDISRIESGRLSFHFEETNLSDLALELIDRFEDQLAQAGIMVKTEINPEIRAFCDKFRIEQVITNLMTNAIKYAAGRPITVCLLREDGHVTYKITDQGMGIPKEKLPLIFNRFERAVPRAGISGLGLGLYISNNIIRAHEGKMGVKSEEGVGSTFSFTIPVNQSSNKGAT